MTRVVPLAAICLLAACSGGGGGGNVPGDSADTAPFAGIAETEVIHLTGTEPFWGGDIEAGIFTYSDPENIGGIAIPVTRFAGRGGVSFSGEWQGASLDLAVTPGECSDGMSERVFPFTATLQWGERQLQGCGWSDAHPYEGEP